MAARSVGELSLSTETAITKAISWQTTHYKTAYPFQLQHSFFSFSGGGNSGKVNPVIVKAQPVPSFP